MSKVPDTTTTAGLGEAPRRQISSQEGEGTKVNTEAKSGKRRSNWGRKRRSPNHGFTALLTEGQLAGNAPGEGEQQPADDGRDAPDVEDAARRDPRVSATPRAAASATGWEGEETSADDDDDDDTDEDPEGGDEGEHVP